jgi:MFS family permease
LWLQQTWCNSELFEADTLFPFSNAAVIGNVELLLAVLYPEALTTAIYSRLSNAFLIGMIIGMLFFGVVVDQLGRKTGAVATTTFLVLGIVLSAAASGTSPTGLFWMLIIARGIAGVGAGGECKSPFCFPDIFISRPSFLYR